VPYPPTFDYAEQVNRDNVVSKATKKYDVRKAREDVTSDIKCPERAPRYGH
jgi:hypothetical protein